MDEYKKKSGASAVNILSLPNCEWGDAANTIVSALYKLHDPSAYAYGGMVYTEYPAKATASEGYDALTQYRELMEIGFDGIKIIETKPTSAKMLALPVNSSFYEKMFKKAEEDGTHFIWHVADPEFFWDKNKSSAWNYGDGSYPTFSEILDAVYDVLERHKKLNVTFAHFFFAADDTGRLEELFAKYPNVGVDITPGTEMYKAFTERKEFFKEFFEKYSDRIMFGTDCSFPEECDNIKLSEAVRNVFTENGGGYNIWGYMSDGLGLKKEVVNAMFYENFLKKHNRPKKINVASLKRYFNKYSSYMANDMKIKLSETLKNI